ncbi:MAG: hypothetical protein ACREOC_09590 [Gemmatimonadales bacterium]
MEVVEQPIARRADVDLVLGGGGEPGVRVVEDAAGLVQPLEEAGPPRGGTARDHPLAQRHGARPIGQVFGAEQFATDRPGKLLFTPIAGAVEELQ